MKKIVSLVLALTLLLLVGCSGGSGKESSEIAVNDLAVPEAITENYGGDTESAMSALGLTEENKHEQWDGMYTGSFSWCGKDVDTDFVFVGDNLTDAYGGISISNDDSAKESVEYALECFKAQFGEPTYYNAQFDWAYEAKQDYDAQMQKDYMKRFWDAEEGASLCYGFARDVGEATDEDRCYIECVFMRNELTNPGEVVMYFQMASAGFGRIDKDTDINSLF